jgi:CrcB protein
MGIPEANHATTLSLGWNWLLVGVGGAVGSVARYEISRRLIAASALWHFPVGTFAVNVLGGFLFGLAAALILQKLPQPLHYWYLLAGVGFCGGFTTFSTYSSETFKLLVDGKWGVALTYALASVLLSLAALAGGVALGHWLGNPAAKP